MTFSVPPTYLPRLANVVKERPIGNLRLIGLLGVTNSKVSSHFPQRMYNCLIFKGVLLVFTVTLVSAIPKPDFGLKLGDEGGKKCTLERETSKV